MHVELFTCNNLSQHPPFDRSLLSPDWYFRIESIWFTSVNSHDTTPFQRPLFECLSGWSRHSRKALAHKSLTLKEGILGMAPLRPSNPPTPKPLMPPSLLSKREDKEALVSTTLGGATGPVWLVLGLSVLTLSVVEAGFCGMENEKFQLSNPHNKTVTNFSPISISHQCALYNLEQCFPIYKLTQSTLHHYNHSKIINCGKGTSLK